jgi:hypothetical protein
VVRRINLADSARSDEREVKLEGTLLLDEQMQGNLIFGSCRVDIACFFSFPIIIDAGVGQMYRPFMLDAKNAR